MRSINSKSARVCGGLALELAFGRGFVYSVQFTAFARFQRKRSYGVRNEGRWAQIACTILLAKEIPVIETGWSAIWSAVCSV